MTQWQYDTLAIDIINELHAVLQNIMSSHQLFAVLHHWIPGNTNHHTITTARNYNEKKLRISVYNDYDWGEPVQAPL